MSSHYLLIHLVIRVPKEHSAFVYFTLEAHEGICMYSTIGESLHCAFRDVDIKATQEFALEIRTIIAELKNKIPLQMILDETISDH